LDEDILQVSITLKQIDAEPFVGTKEVSLPQSFKRLVSNKLWDSYKEFFAIWLQLLVRPSFFAKLIVNKKFEGLEPIKFFVLSLATCAFLYKISMLRIPTQSRSIQLSMISFQFLFY
jgi:hypothetical protein